MLRFIIKRILLMIPVILGVLLIVFAVSRLSGDPVAYLIGPYAAEEDYEAMREDLGLNRPFFVQYVDYVKGVVTEFDLGQSYLTKKPVTEEIFKRLPTSMTLAFVSLGIATVIGIVFGVIGAVNQNSKFDYLITMLSLVCASLPGFWTGLMLILLFSVGLDLLPATGLESWKGWIMPCIALGLTPIASLCRTTRSSMLEVIRQDYIRTAKSKGISDKRVVFKHALKNAIFPVITVIGTMVSIQVGGAVVVETVFTIPGIGSLLTEAINNKDYPTMQGTVLVLSLIVCVINLLIDIAYGFVDPRIKAKYTQKTTKKPRKEKEAVVS